MTLTETATITKRFLRVFLIFGGAFLILWIAFLLIYNNIIIPYQKSQIKPEKRFGALPPPSYPPSLISSSSLGYSLDTNSGALPTNLPRLIPVYFITPSQTTLLSPDRARQLAVALNFPSGPEILSPSVYRFRDSNGGTLTIDLNTSNFTYQRNPAAAQPSSPQDQLLPDQSQITTSFHDYLSQKGLLKAGLDGGPMSVLYDKTDNKDSSTAAVSIYPVPINKIPIITSNPNLGLINATVTKYQEETLRYLKLQYTYWPIDLQTFSTYQLEPISLAYQQLQQGQGIIVKNQTTGGKASITSIYLAYFMPDTYSAFLEPVYVFDGDQFRAFVPALTADSYAH